MEEQPIRTGGLGSEWCCIILAAMILILEYYSTGQITIWSIYIVIIIAFFILTSFYTRFSIRRKVYSHLLKFSNTKVPIQNIMTDLQLGFYDIMFILEDIQKKKKLPIEITEKTGEVIIGNINGKSSKITTKIKEDDLKITDEAVTPREDVSSEKKYKCSNCGKEMAIEYKYCPSCGRPLKKNE